MNPDSCITEARLLCVAAMFYAPSVPSQATALLNEAYAVLKLRASLLRHLPVPGSRRSTWLLGHAVH